MSTSTDIGFETARTPGPAVIVSRYGNIVVGTERQSYAVIRREISVLADVEVHIERACVVESEGYERLTGIVYTLKVIYRIRHSPREPEGNRRVHIGYVYLESVGEVAAEITRPEVLIDVTVAVAGRQVGPGYRVFRNCNSAVRVNFRISCEILT